MIHYNDEALFREFVAKGKAYGEGTYDFTFEDRYIIYHVKVSQYLSGKVVPSQRKLTVLALGLNVTEPWLMGYDVDQNEISMTLSPHERKLILAYRYHTEMQDAVDRLLDITEEKKTEKSG